MHEEKKSPVKSNGTKTTTRSKKQGGWADETQQSNRAFSAIEKRLSSIKLKKQGSGEETPTPASASVTDFNCEEEDVDIASNLMIENHNRVAAYKELNDNCISKQNLAHFLDGVDLQLLTRNILPESQLKEVLVIPVFWGLLYTTVLIILKVTWFLFKNFQTDVLWNWDVLFAEMVPVLTLDGKKSTV